MKQISNFLIFCAFSSSILVQGKSVNVSDKCLNCICEASTGCDKNAICDGPVCGPYRISLPYWIDAGSPKLSEDYKIMTSNDKLNEKQNISADSDQPYRDCVNNFICASRAVTAYMKRYARDCDGDGLVNCDDYARIHRNGPLACSSNLDYPFKNAYEKCIREF